jgi:hypothetical protein
MGFILKFYWTKIQNNHQTFYGTYSNHMAMQYINWKNVIKFVLRIQSK